MQFDQSIKASEFKAKCLHLMDIVNESGKEIVITKNGKPISKLVPYRKRLKSLFGLHKGQIVSHDDLIEPLDLNWDACDDSS
ncbi:MAG: type II toxin-antitoxin system prevent-host-death family antitoxin [Thermodesulfobacteriota bacterium]|nr:type II toxin-antitoxin system prevent-host-death family antitoxin [Thermodesulfobacteriota bacterium]